MNSDTNQTAQTNEPIISVPSHLEQPMLPQSLGGTTETILAVAVLIRSVALLIQVIGQQKGRK